MDHLDRPRADPPTKPEAPCRPVWLAPLIDYGPLLVFLVAYFGFGLLIATAATMLATVLALLASLLLSGRIPAMALFSGGMLLVLGGLTLCLNDDRYLKLQSTLTSAIFSAGLFAAYAMRWPILRDLCGNAIALSDRGWQILTLRLALFFALMAGLNELIVRTQSNDFWAQYYSYGSSVLTLAFLAAQWRLIGRHLLPAEIESRDLPGEHAPGE